MNAALKETLKITGWFIGMFALVSLIMLLLVGLMWVGEFAKGLLP